MTVHTAPAPSEAESRPISHRIGAADLPVGICRIDLAAPPASLPLLSPIDAPAKILALVVREGRPLGVVLLDGARGLAWTAHADAVTDALAAEIAADEARTEAASPPEEARDTRPPGAGPLISAVVATRNRTDSLRETLHALLASDHPSFEVIVVDNDPSSDDTAEMVAAEFADVTYVREYRRGLAAAHNRGVALARGEIVAFVDDDVLVDRHWLARIADGFRMAPDVGCVTGLILPSRLETPAQLLLEQHGGFDKGFTPRIVDLGANRPDDPLFPFTAGRLGSGANMAFDRRVLAELGGFDPALGAGTLARGGDDLAGFFRVLARGHRLVYQPAAVVWHRHHRDLAALRTQAEGYGTGLGAYLASAVVTEPRMLGSLLVRLPRGLRYAFAASSDRNRHRYDHGPADLARLERRGLLRGPLAYVRSRRQIRRAQNPRPLLDHGATTR